MEIDRSVAPALHKIHGVRIPEVQKHLLDNHIPLYYAHDEHSELIKVELLFRAGNWREDRSGIAHFTIKQIAEGTPTRTARHIIDELDQYGSFLELFHGFDYTSLTLIVQKKYLSQVIDILDDVLSNAQYPEKELSAYKLRLEQQLKINEKKNDIIASQAFRKLLFGEDHPYGRVLKANDFSTIQREDLQRFLSKNYVLSNGLLLVSGNIDHKTLKIFNQYFGSKRQVDAAPEEKEYRSLSMEKKQVRIPTENQLQSSLQIGGLLFPKNHPDFFPFYVTNMIFGGYFGSRLMQNIRENKGYTYGIYSRINRLHKASYWYVAADVKKSSGEAALKEIYAEMKKLREDKVSHSELERVKNYITGYWARSIENVFSYTELFQGIYFHHLDYSFYQTYLENMGKVTSEKILEMANTYFTNDVIEVLTN